eukprot:jgi/Botrbrau1/18522/Bobra.0072s0097.1
MQSNVRVTAGSCLDFKGSAIRPTRVRISRDHRVCHLHAPGCSRRGRNVGMEVKAVAQEVKEATDTPTAALTAFDRVEILSESLPYLQMFRGKTIVVKYGGAAMKNPSLMGGVINDLVLLSTVGILPVLVHGGGPEINQWLKRVGIESKFDAETGLRVTDEPTMEVVQAVLAGTVNKNLVRLIQQAGGRAVGLCGIDGGVIMARQVLEGRIGLVGDITSIDASLVKVLVGSSFLPVISSVALDPQGRSLNVNADIAAGEIAAALQAEKLDTDDRRAGSECGTRMISAPKFYKI